MNIRRYNEIKVVIAAMTITAALISGAMTARSANAAPPTKKHTTAKKVVKVKIAGSRRAAMNRATALANVTTTTQTAPSTPTTPSGQTEDYGSGETVPGSVSTVGTPPPGIQPLNSNPVNNVQGTPVQPNPQFNNPIGATNVPGVVNYYAPNGYALYGPPVVNTGNGFVPLYGNGYNLNGSTIAPYNGFASPYSNYFSNGFNPNGSISFSF